MLIIIISILSTGFAKSQTNLDSPCLETRKYLYSVLDSIYNSYKKVYIIDSKEFNFIAEEDYKDSIFCELLNISSKEWLSKIEKSKEDLLKFCATEKRIQGKKKNKLLKRKGKNNFKNLFINYSNIIRVKPNTFIFDIKSYCSGLCMSKFRIILWVSNNDEIEKVFFREISTS